MANIYRGNVWVIDTSGQIDGRLRICGVKLMSGSDASTVTIKQNATGGDVVYEAKAASAGQNYDRVQMELDSAYVTISGTTPKVYIYLE
jgi:hypothetical protein